MIKMPKKNNYKLKKNLINLFRNFFNDERIKFSTNILGFYNKNKILKFIEFIENNLDIKLKNKNYFLSKPSVKRLYYLIQNFFYIETKTTPVEIKPTTKKLYYSLTRPQMVFWKAEKKLPSGFFNVVSIVRFNEKICLKSLNKAFEDLIQRHESLRITFLNKGSKVVQKINDGFEIKINSSVSLENYDGLAFQKKISKIFKNERKKSFNLEKNFLVRAKLIKLRGGKYILIIVVHHLVFDFKSKYILSKDLELIYDYYVGKIKKHPFPKDKNILKYHDYLDWENKNKFKKQEDYWLKIFSSKDLPYLKLPFSSFKPEIKDKNFCNFRYLFLNKEQLINIKKICNSYNLTYFDFFFGVLSFFLYNLTYSQEIPIGTTVDLRKTKSMENLIGMLMSTIIIINKIDTEKSFLSHLLNFKENILEAINNADVPFSYLVENNNLIKGKDRKLMQVFFEVFYYPEELFLNRKEEEIKKEFSSKLNFSKYTPFDISQEVFVAKDVLKLQLIFNSNFFDQKEIDSLFKKYGLLLNKLIKK